METQTKLKRETWRDWLPPGVPEPQDDELIDRDELLRRVNLRGNDVTPRTLRLWESLGMTPGPVRKWHDGAVRALYPVWCERLVELAAFGRRMHADTDEIRKNGRDHLPWIAREYIIYAHPFVGSTLYEALQDLADLINGQRRELGRSDVDTVIVTFRDQDLHTVWNKGFRVAPHGE